MRCCNSSHTTFTSAAISSKNIRPSARPIATHVIREGVVYDDGDVRVTAFEVDHLPVKPAFGYRFDSGGSRSSYRATPGLTRT